MTNFRAEYLESICRLFVAELVSAEAKHPDWPDDIVHQAAIVAEEAGELLQAANTSREEGPRLWHSKHKPRIIHEATQAGASALRLLLNLEGGK